MRNALGYTGLLLEVLKAHRVNGTYHRRIVNWYAYHPHDQISNHHQCSCFLQAVYADLNKLVITEHENDFRRYIDSVRLCFDFFSVLVTWKTARLFASGRVLRTWSNTLRIPRPFENYEQYHDGLRILLESDKGLYKAFGQSPRTKYLKTENFYLTSKERLTYMMGFIDAFYCLSGKLCFEKNLHLLWRKCVLIPGCPTKALY